MRNPFSTLLSALLPSRDKAKNQPERDRRAHAKFMQTGVIPVLIAEQRQRDRAELLTVRTEEAAARVE